MADTPAIAASRLPDLPNAGYSTRKQKELSDAIMFLIRGFERERLLLLETVILGKDLWRKRFNAAFRVIGADDEFADAVFGYFVLLAGPNPEFQKLAIEGDIRQRTQQQWDFRQRTTRLFGKAKRELHANIRKELAEQRKKKVTFS